MFATITWDENGGYWFAEVDSTHESIFIHQKNVKKRRRLHLGDRVKLDIAPSDRKPGETEGVNVEWVGVSK